ncbi:uncharacterized protein LOC119735229 [Patiria miniata]|uniref:Uncharacterized protein n=1 Tax=Patiria miniata TaxID=46514 RepID=A0A914ALI7_PATMI|nr:uncharacterized protein LOC119734717 [Patiria miniata]XP_038064865.1 uncharacterized protein LOC119735229 [Patiria miniata]
MDILEVVEKVNARVRVLSTQKLLGVCEHLGLETGDTAEKVNGHQRLVQNTYSDEVLDRADGGIELLQGLDGFIDGIAGPEVVPDEAAVSAKSAKPDSSDEPLEVQPAPLKLVPAKSEQPTVGPEVLSLMRREFKIFGQIGEPGQKDRLTFTSLAHQIETGREKGYRTVKSSKA